MNNNENTTNSTSWADMVDNTTVTEFVPDTVAVTETTATATTTATETTEPIVGTTYFARVKWFNGTKGYGFVTVLDTQSDLFVHHSEIKTTVSCWKTLNTGEYVQLVVGTDDVGKTCARQVTGIQGGQLMCESNANNTRNSSTETTV